MDPVYEDPVPEETGSFLDELLDLLEAHWKLIATIGAFLFIALKLAAVSRFNFSTATALVSSSGLLQVAAGALFVALRNVVLFIGLALVTLGIAMTDPSSGQSEDQGYVVAGLGLLITLLGVATYQSWLGALQVVAFWLLVVAAPIASARGEGGARRAIPGISQTVRGGEGTERAPGAIKRTVSGLGSWMVDHGVALILVGGFAWV